MKAILKRLGLDKALPSRLSRTAGATSTQGGLQRRLISLRRAQAVVVVCLVAGPAISARAQVTIDVGTFSLPAETSTTAAVQVYVNNPGPPTPVGSLDFYVEVAAAGPKIKSVDLLSETVFEFNHTGPFPSGSNTDHLQYFGLTRDFSQSAPSLPSGLSQVASIAFDTLAIAPGDYAFKLTGTGFGDTDYFDANGDPLGISVLNGMLTVVPEPAEQALVIGLGLISLAAGRRLWRHRSERV